MPITEDIKEAFSGDRGKVLLIGGAVALGVIWWTRQTGAPQDIPAEALGAQATPGGVGGHTVGTAPGGSAGGAGSSRPQTNAQWLSQGVDLLLAQTAPPSGADAYSALVKALEGKPLSTVEINMVSKVISTIGSPPEGMPPLAPAPPGGGGGGGTGDPPPVGTTVAPPLNYNIYSWCAEIASRYHLPGFKFEVMESLNPGIRSYIKWLPNPGFDWKIPIFYKTPPPVRIR